LTSEQDTTKVPVDGYLEEVDVREALRDHFQIKEGWAYEVMHRLAKESPHFHIEKPPVEIEYRGSPKSIIEYRACFIYTDDAVISGSVVKQ